MDAKHDEKTAAKKKLTLSKESLKSMRVKSAIKSGVSNLGWCTQGCATYGSCYGG